MASGDRPVYYWDTNMWIVYLNGGTEHPDVYERAEEIAKLIRRNQVTIVTSVITRAELLDRRLGPVKLRKYDEQLQRKNVVEQPVTRATCVRASDFRSHFPSIRKGPKFADAIHLATAVDNHVDELHTTDEDDLLPCNGDTMLGGTQVVRPVSDKPSLFSLLPTRQQPATPSEAPPDADVAQPPPPTGEKELKTEPPQQSAAPPEPATPTKEPPTETAGDAGMAPKQDLARDEEA